MSNIVKNIVKKHGEKHSPMSQKMNNPLHRNFRTFSYQGYGQDKSAKGSIDSNPIGRMIQEGNEIYPL
jgi:hypothetical protein